MQVQTWSIGDVHPYHNNPRNNAATVKPVANSIKEFGWQQPIVVDKDGVIIVGHTRYKAAKMLKLKEVPVVVADNLTEDQVKAYRIADNSTGEVADWDIPLLNVELQGPDYDFSQFGLEVTADTEGEAFRAMFREAGWELHGCLIWVKNSLVLGRADYQYQYQHEPCLYGWKPGAGHYFINDRTNTTVIDDAKPEDLKKMKKEDLLAWATRVQEFLQKEQTTVLRYDKPAANKEHPTMKPVPLVGHLIKNSSKPGQIVLDLFGGSGSTLIACEQMNRRCFMMEYDPQYADVIIDRWEQFTGREAVRIQ